MKQKSSKPEKTSASALPLAMPLILPIVTLLLCAAIVLVCSLRPYEKLHTYLQIAFMDDLKQAPSSSSDGLEIVQNDITTNYSGKIAKTGEPVYPAFGEQYGVLSCEAIDLYVPVYWGATSELLELGACQTTASAIAGAGGNAVISAHVNTFFNRLDGYHVQYNVVSRDTLIDAQKHPQKYRDLIVRVAGYSAFFHDLSRQTQDDIIERTEQTL